MCSNPNDEGSSRDAGVESESHTKSTSKVVDKIVFDSLKLSAMRVHVSH